MGDKKTAFHSWEYDDKIKQTIPYYEELYRQTVDVVRCFSNEPLAWLDIGCGTGKMAEAAFKEFTVGRFVFCDPSPDMLETARQRFSRPNKEFAALAVQELSFHEEFDVVTAIQVNHYLNRQERETAIHSCYEALKDNGIFITFENFAPFSEAGRDYFPITLKEQLALIKKSGFQAAELLWLSCMQAGFIGIKGRRVLRDKG